MLLTEGGMRPTFREKQLVRGIRRELMLISVGSSVGNTVLISIREVLVVVILGVRLYMRESIIVERVVLMLLVLV